MNTLQKVKPIRDKKYIEWIRSLDCLICRYPAPSDPHHTETGGKGTKGSDLSCLPLCHRHHQEAHTKGRNTFAKMYDVDYFYTTERLKGIYYGINGEQ